MTVYNEIAAVNFSTLKHLEKGPLHYKAALARKFKQTAAMAKGSMIHTLVLEPEQFDVRYCINDQSRNSNAFKALAALEADAGRTVVKSKDVAEARLVADSVLSNPDAMRLLANAKFEQTLTWNMEGFDCKGRADALRVTGTKPILVDLKTTTDPQPWHFGKQVYDMRYHAQMAFYAAGMMAVYGIDYPDVYIIAVGNTEPYECVVYKLPLEVMDAGEQMYMGWMDTLERCRKDDSYKSSYAGIKELRLPSYAYDSLEAETSLIIGGKEVQI